MPAWRRVAAAAGWRCSTSAQALGHRLVQHRVEAGAQGLAVGGPQAHAGGVLGVVAQPGLDLARCVGIALAVEPGDSSGRR
jgi:hypothetical protein